MKVPIRLDVSLVCEPLFQNYGVGWFLRASYFVQASFINKTILYTDLFRPEKIIDKPRINERDSLASNVAARDLLDGLGCLVGVQSHAVERCLSLTTTCCFEPGRVSGTKNREKKLTLFPTLVFMKRCMHSELAPYHLVMLQGTFVCRVPHMVYACAHAPSSPLVLACPQFTANTTCRGLSFVRVSVSRT